MDITAESVELGLEQRTVAHELARRRVYLFTMFFFLVGSLAAVSQDSHLVQQVTDVISGVTLLAGFAVIGISWRYRSPGKLRQQHNILFVLTVVLAALLPFNFDIGRLLFTGVLALNRLL